MNDEHDNAQDDKAILEKLKTTMPTDDGDELVETRAILGNAMRDLAKAQEVANIYLTIAKAEQRRVMQYAADIGALNQQHRELILHGGAALIAIKEKAPELSSDVRVQRFAIYMEDAIR